MNERKPRFNHRSDPYLIILVAAFVGAVAGGAWLGMIFAVLSSPQRQPFDLIAGFVSVSLLAAVLYVLADHHERWALRTFSTLTVFAALASYLTH